MAAGTSSLAPLYFVTGTDLATPVAGAMEFDGTQLHFTEGAGERSSMDVEEWIANTATYQLTSQTAAQKLFNSPTNGALTVDGSRTYAFECAFSLSSMSGTSGSFGFALGGTATISTQKWVANASKTGLDATQSTIFFGMFTAAAASLTANNATTTAFAHIRGIIRVAGGGTIIPQVSLTQAAAAVVGVNSFFRLWPIGTNTQVSQGNWS